MPRPTRSTPTTKRSVTLPNELWQFIDSLDIDPIRKKPRYGSQARILERLVREEQRRMSAVEGLAEEEPPLSDYSKQRCRVCKDSPEIANRDGTTVYRCSTPLCSNTALWRDKEDWMEACAIGENPNAP